MKTMRINEALSTDNPGQANVKSASAESSDSLSVKAVTLKIANHLRNPKAKRIFLRFYPTVHINVHWISDEASLRYKVDRFHRIEDYLRAKQAMLDEVLVASVQYAREPLASTASVDAYVELSQLDPSIKSPIAHSYIAAAIKLDGLLSTLDSLVARGIVTDCYAGLKRAQLRKAFKHFANAARSSALRLRGLTSEHDRHDGLPSHTIGDSPAHNPSIHAVGLEQEQVATAIDKRASTAQADR